MIHLKTFEEIETIKEGSKILSEILYKIKQNVKPGITTKELNDVAEKLMKENKVEPAFLNYDGFPALLCTSVNEIIVHGVPSNYKLKEGDIVSLDIGIKYKGYYSDMAITVGVGKISKEAEKLIRCTKKSLELVIQKVKAGNTFGDVGFLIQNFLEKNKLSVIKELCGHGIGKNLHEEPEILNFGERREGIKIEEGMVFCVEPMASLGSWKIKKVPDGFGWQTQDNSLSAHFEHTIAVYKNKLLNLTYFRD
ncbi:MAG: type I methionyl aminopeptidase [Minisyncoccia bacterium]